MTQLQEAIRDKITKYSDACGMCTDIMKDCDICGVIWMLEDLNELQRLANNLDAVRPIAHWTNIKKRPPDDGEEVICYCGNKDYPECYGDIYILTFYTDTGWLLGDAVTHWMPKPKPPEDAE